MSRHKCSILVQIPDTGKTKEITWFRGASSRSLYRAIAAAFDLSENDNLSLYRTDTGEFLDLDNTDLIPD
ncbi:unnamed protein product, partial [Heterosigma akashiwo]